MLVLHKLLPLIVSPLGVVVFLIIVSAVLKRRGPAVLALIVLWVCALPATERMVWRGLESDYPYQEVAVAPATDAIIVLSGMLEGAETDRGIRKAFDDQLLYCIRSGLSAEAAQLAQAYRLWEEAVTVRVARIASGG